MPWTATVEFCSPFVNADKGETTNYYSYGTVDRFIWSGMKDIVNDWRSEVLHIPPIRTHNFSGHQLIQTRKIPFLYCFSPSLVPKPKDWESHIHVNGFWCLEKSDWKPDENLQKFLDSGSKPVFIGFGSICIKDPKEFSQKVIEGIQKAKIRAIVQNGWTKLDGKKEDYPDIYFIDSAPHDQLFPYCSAVVHHGGAGTTANGLIAGKPTLIVPFFGDQFFWGKMIHEQGAGAAPLPHKSFTVDDFVSRIHETLNCKEKAKEIKKKIENENGIKSAIDVIHNTILNNYNHEICCDICNELEIKNECKTISPAQVICLDCKLKFCGKHNYISHFMIPDLMHHRRHRNRVVHWNIDGSNSGKNIHAVVDGIEALASTWIGGVTGIVNEPSAGSKDGPVGIIKGLGKGVASLVSSTVTGPVNLVTTTTAGIVRTPYEDMPFHVCECYPPEISEEDSVKSISTLRYLIQSNIESYKAQHPANSEIELSNY